MSSLLAGAVVAVLGGDDRELVLVPRLLELGADVRVAGISMLADDDRVKYFNKVQDAVSGAGFVILPMPGIDPAGVIKAKYGVQPLHLNRDIMSSFQDGCVVITGVARPLLKELVSARDIKLIELAEMDEVAILNSIPSAEGAVQMAMAATDITLHGSNTLVIGFGRCGVTLSRMVAAIGARTSVVARKPADLARAREMGLNPMTYKDLPGSISEMDIIFNTVPALVLDKELLLRANPWVYICDLASAPGGVDYTAAKELGLTAELAPGLPGKFSPRTAGQILAKVIPDIIFGELKRTSSSSLDLTEGSRGCFDAT